MTSGGVRRVTPGGATLHGVPLTGDATARVTTPGARSPLLRARGVLEAEALPDGALDVLQLEGIQVPRGGPRPPARRPGRRSAFVEGFSLHADTWLHENDVTGLEQLCNHGARGPLSLERLSALPDGRLAHPPPDDGPRTALPSAAVSTSAHAYGHRRSAPRRPKPHAPTHASVRSRASRCIAGGPAPPRMPLRVRRRRGARHAPGRTRAGRGGAENGRRAARPPGQAGQRGLSADSWPPTNGASLDPASPAI